MTDLLEVDLSQLTAFPGQVPAQWACQTTDRRWLYVRYRAGTLTAVVGQTIDAGVRKLLGEDTGATIIARRGIGPEHDGSLTTEQMTERLDDVIHWR